MSLPFYHHYNMRSASFEELNNLLTTELNLKYPVVINLKPLDMDQQREIIGLIENYFVSNNLSFRYPYPVYVITEHEATISHLPLVRVQEELPRFFLQRDGKMNVKESHLASKNKLLQQEIHNSDAGANEQELMTYALIHRQIHYLEIERTVYKSLLTKLLKGKENG